MNNIIKIFFSEDDIILKECLEKEMPQNFAFQDNSLKSRDSIYDLHKSK